MIMDVVKLGEFLNSIYTAELFVDYCVNGLHIDSGSKHVKKICTCVTPTEAAINFAVSIGADVIVSHHAMFWKGDLISLKGALGRKVSKLYGNGISLFVFHFPMDSNIDYGNNWPAAKFLGLSSLVPFGKDSSSKMHWGVGGEFSMSVSAAGLVDMVKNCYHVPNPRVACSNLELVIKRVAICSGGSHRFFDAAIEEGYDAYIAGTGDIKQFDAAIENNKLFISVGHFASERMGPLLLADLIANMLNIESVFFDEYNVF